MQAQIAAIFSHNIARQHVPTVTCAGRFLVRIALRLFHRDTSGQEHLAFRLETTVLRRVILHSKGQLHKFFHRVELVFHLTLPFLQISQLAHTGHIDVEVEVRAQLGDVAHKDLAPVLFHADHRFFQQQLVVVWVRDGHRKGERAGIVCFQRQLRVKDKGGFLVVRIIQNVPFGPVVALSVRSTLDLPNVHNVAGRPDALHFAALYGGGRAIRGFHGQRMLGVLCKTVQNIIRQFKAVHAILNCRKCLMHHAVDLLGHGHGFFFRVGYLVQEPRSLPPSVQAVLAEVVAFDLRCFVAGQKTPVVHRSVFIHAEAYQCTRYGGVMVTRVPIGRDVAGVTRVCTFAALDANTLDVSPAILIVGVRGIVAGFRIPAGKAVLPDVVYIPAVCIHGGVFPAAAEGALPKRFPSRELYELVRCRGKEPLILQRAAAVGAITVSDRHRYDRFQGSFAQTLCIGVFKPVAQGGLTLPRNVCFFAAPPNAVRQDLRPHQQGLPLAVQVFLVVMLCYDKFYRRAVLVHLQGLADGQVFDNSHLLTSPSLRRSAPSGCRCIRWSSFRQWSSSCRGCCPRCRPCVRQGR